MQAYSSAVEAESSTAAATKLNHNSIEESSTNRAIELSTNPFTTPGNSQPVSRIGSSFALNTPPGPKYFHSRRVKKGTVERPWLDRKDPKEKWVTIIPLLGIAFGLAVSGVLIWDGLRSVVNHTYCPVLDENWSNGFNPKLWMKEAEVGGFGNGQFEQTTNTDENVFVKDGKLYIKPTLQDSKLIETDGSILNLTKLGICSSDKFANCVTSTNVTNGSIINPVKSGRISTRIGPKIKFGRIEVTAQLPAGDWLWPAIWMLPVDSKYGPWPRSGEIDIMESRGNNHTYRQGGNNIVSSTLHWGPNPANDGWWTNNVKRMALHTTYSKGFHTFGLEWSEKYLFTYIDTRLLQVMYSHFEEPLFARGHFPLSDSNGTKLDDPWSHTGRVNTPFDEDFYLILNVAVGGTNGWFQDGKSGKPWVDGSPTAKNDFWKARDSWYPTWKDGGSMIVKSVKMWQQKGYNGC
ncbi:glucan endo-1,3-beta-D-glucosidase [Tothia fuscella]|uniref:Glucan endo-1,3-beta-D-glucosidase n=1 Tax=Tothia fuscella TaxID=1048955 RepID=A0A9P4NRH6_9PEZI|nr:glucan endo-1,3-beta-D-glucosidase [Tothia fuscella]